MRGKQASNRPVEGDIKYNNPLITRLTNHLMERGKKSLAQRLVYGAFEVIQKKSGKDPVAVFDEAMRNIAPAIEVKSRRIGGANYQIPIEVRGHRRETLAMRWIIDAARSRKGPMKETLAAELLDAAAKQGEAFKKREDVRRMAEANRAFAHFAR